MHQEERRVTSGAIGHGVHEKGDSVEIVVPIIGVFVDERAKLGRHLAVRTFHDGFGLRMVAGGIDLGGVDERTELRDDLGAERCVAIGLQLAECAKAKYEAVEESVGGSDGGALTERNIDLEASGGVDDGENELVAVATDRKRSVEVDQHGVERMVGHLHGHRVAIKLSARFLVELALGAGKDVEVEVALVATPVVEGAKAEECALDA